MMRKEMATMLLQGHSLWKRFESKASEKRKTLNTTAWKREKRREKGRQIKTSPKTANNNKNNK